MANLAFENRIVSVKGSKLFCRRIGASGNPIIVIHGGPGLSQDYLLELARLSECSEVIFYDQRAAGRSTGLINQNAMQIDQAIEDLDDLRAAYQLDKISLIGHSWGGIVALLFAIKKKSVVDKLILLNSMSASYQYDPCHTNHYMEGIKKIKESYGFKSQQEKLIEESYRDLFRPFFYDPKKINLLNLCMTKRAAVHSILVREAFEESFFKKSYNYLNELNKLNTPSLIIHGEHDLIPFSVSKDLHESLTHSQLICIKECGHFSHIEQASILFDNLISFMKSS